MSRSKVLLGISLILIVAFFAAQSFSQDGGRGRGQGGPGGGAQMGPMGERGQGRGGMSNRDPEEMRRMMQERMRQRIKQNLNATDEEWTKIEPALTKVMTLSRETEGMGMMGRGMMGRGMMNRRGQGPEGQAPEAAEPETKLEKARAALQTSLQGDDKEAIQKNLDAYRTARNESKKELVAAQQELKKTVTLKQEAELVMMGYLD